ncbi:MAG TPA: DUF3857 domain-containing protein [Chitinophagaceae bacterium]|nr:DUF3857 domain-containing protein [Chitinophagaceae bacterium]
MNQLPLYKKFPFFLLLFSCGVASSQRMEEVKSIFPGEDAVVLRHSVAYELSVKNGQPNAESRERDEIMYLSSNAATYMTKYSFYQSGFHELQGYQAFTKTADGKKIKVTDFKTDNSTSGGIFYDDVKETTFDFPALNPGAVGNLEVNQLHKDPRLLSPFYFTRGVPVMQAELTITCPKEMLVKYVLKGNDQDKIHVNIEQRRSETVYTFKANNLPGERPYADAPSRAYYAPHVVFYIEKYKNDKGELIPYLSSPNDLYRMNYSFLKGINTTLSPELKQVVDSIVSGLSSTEEKARRIYRWVQSNIKYVAFEDGMGGFIPRDASLVCTRRFGDCKDMSSILTVMLKAAGVPAFYTWIGTRHLPYSYEETPLPIVDNHMITTILLQDKYLFLDGTDGNCVFGMPSAMIQGKEALVAINDTSYKILTVPVPPKETSTLVDSTLLTLTPNGLKGKIHLSLTGYYAMDLHSIITNSNANDQEKYFKSRLTRGSNKFRLDSFSVARITDFNKVELFANFDLQGYARKIADDWYLNMNLFKLYEHEEIDYPKRKMPIEFPFLYQKKHVVALAIPEGYTISALPASKHYSNDVWGFTIDYTVKNNQLILTQQFDNDHLLLSPDKFQDWNKVLENLFPCYKEIVSLTKKNL